jgi:hypothetical protein
MDSKQDGYFLFTLLYIEVILLSLIGDNRGIGLGSGLGLDQTSRISLTFWKKLDQVELNQFTCCIFFRFLIDFN